ncbi:hypothetical protein KM043_013501 [Ampulex compressa]|nr:hypothetical protein KM043_013501 [Ampulex compressa]
MSGKIEYLEKYSVAPPPSRDYYGLRVLRDEVILYLWKISHGPHKAPFARTVKFPDFADDKLLQDEIQRGFGERLLKHVRNVTGGNRNTLLTLPKSVIRNLINYLSLNDIVKLSLLSHVANLVFDDNSVWEVLYERCKKTSVSKQERFYGMAYGWKQLFKDQQVENLEFRPTSLRDRPVSKQIRTRSRKEEEIRPSSSITKVTRKIGSANIERRKPPEMSRNHSVADSSFEKVSDSRLNQSKATVETKKHDIQKKASSVTCVPKSAQKAIADLKEQSAAPKSSIRLESNAGSVSRNKMTESKSTSERNRVQRNPAQAKSSNAKIKLADSRTNLSKSRTSSTRSEDAIVSNELMKGRFASKGQTNLNLNQSKLKDPKLKSKGKKVGHSKSTLLTTAKAFDDDIFRGKDSDFELADLIEASLKNIRSPRSIFNSDFSCLEGSRPGAGDLNAQSEIIKKIDALKGSRLNLANMPLDRLSEKSEPSTGKSRDTTRKHDDYDVPFFTGSRLKSRLNKGKKPQVTRNDKSNRSSMLPEDDDEILNFDVYPKYLSPKIGNFRADEGSIKRVDALKSEAFRNLGNRRATSSGKDLDNSTKNQFSSRKAYHF